MLFVGKDVEGERMEIMELKGVCLGFTQVMVTWKGFSRPGKSLNLIVSHGISWKILSYVW